MTHPQPPGSNGHQKPTRRYQMLYAAAHAAQVLEDAAQHLPDPAEVHAAADALRVAAVRMATPKPPRRRPLPRPGDATRYVRDRTSPELDEAAARIVTDAIARLRERATP